MSVPDPQPIQISFAIKTCKCTSFMMTDYAKKNKKLIQDDKFNFSLAIRFDLDSIKNNAIITTISVISNLNDNNEKLAEINAVTEFNILNFDGVVTKNAHGQLGLPDQILISFFSISISNVRGMLSVKLEDTIYTNATLPLIDPAQLIPKKSINVG